MIFLIIPSSIVNVYSQKDSQENKAHVISIMDCPMKKSCFTPCQTIVLKGDVVVWKNRDTNNHMIISGSGQHGPDGWFSSQVISQQKTFSHTFDRKGVFTYYDSTNTYSQGVIIVDSPLDSNFVKIQKSYFSNWWCTK